MSKTISSFHLEKFVSPITNITYEMELTIQNIGLTGRAISMVAINEDVAYSDVEYCKKRVEKLAKGCFDFDKMKGRRPRRFTMEKSKAHATWMLTNV